MENPSSSHRREREHYAALHQTLLAFYDDPTLSMHVRKLFLEVVVNKKQIPHFNSSNPKVENPYWIMLAPRVRLPRTFERFRGLLRSMLTTLIPSSRKKGQCRTGLSALFSLYSSEDLCLFLSRDVKRAFQESDCPSLLRSSRLPWYIVRNEDPFFHPEFHIITPRRLGELLQRHRHTFMFDIDPKNGQKSLKVSKPEGPYVIVEFSLNADLEWSQYIPAYQHLTQSKASKKTFFVPNYSLVSISRYLLPPFILASRFMSGLTLSEDVIRDKDQTMAQSYEIHKKQMDCQTNYVCNGVSG